METNCVQMYSSLMMEMEKYNNVKYCSQRVRLGSDWDTSGINSGPLLDCNGNVHNER